MDTSLSLARLDCESSMCQGLAVCHETVDFLRSVPTGNQTNNGKYHTSVSWKMSLRLDALTFMYDHRNDHFCELTLNLANLLAQNLRFVANEG